MLNGIRIKDLTKFSDERGFFSEIMRTDWQDFIGEDIPVQANLSMSYPGVIRAWHRHSRGQVDYLTVLQGAVKICAYDDESNSPTKGQLDEIIASSKKLQIIRIPGIYWHGTKTLGAKTSVILYLVSRLYDYKAPDEERRPWNDPSIIDPRTAEPYDWNRSPSNKGDDLRLSFI